MARRPDIEAVIKGSPFFPVNTGQLRDSVEVEVDKDGNITISMEDYGFTKSHFQSGLPPEVIIEDSLPIIERLMEDSYKGMLEMKYKGILK